MSEIEVPHPSRVRYAEQVEMVMLKDLIPYARNARTHSDAEVREAMASIIEFGWTNPCLIDPANVLIAGHRRVLAAERLKIAEVPCLRLGWLTDTQKRAYRLADNRIPMNGGWNDELLALEMRDLHGADVDLSQVGFDTTEIEQYLKMSEVPPETTGDPDAIPENVETRCKPGDLWQLGAHRLLCGDSTNAFYVSRLMNGENADICFTSPPYNVASTPGGTNPNIRYRSKDSDNKTHDEYLELLNGFLILAQKFSELQFVNLAWLQGNKLAVIDWLYSHRSHYVDLVVWDKGGSNISPNEVLNSRAECVFCFRSKEFPNRSLKIKDPLRPGSENLVVIRAGGVGNADTHGVSGENSAKFPVEFPEHFIRMIHPASVYEPFCGSGSTLIACEKTGRRCLSMEIDPHYCDVILKRWEDLTGQKAVLLESSAPAQNDLPSATPVA